MNELPKLIAQVEELIAATVRVVVTAGGWVGTDPLGHGRRHEDGQV